MGNNQTPEKLLPPGEPTLPGIPSPAQQQWGTVVSIIVIVLMIVIGAFYAWGKKIAQNEIITPTTAQEL